MKRDTMRMGTIMSKRMETAGAVPQGEQCPQLWTTGRIAEILQVPLHRVQYVLATRPHIQPSARAGHFRLYDRHAMSQIRHELNAIDARRVGSED